MEDWDNLFDFDLTFPTDDDVIIPPDDDVNNQSPPLSVDDIEQLLFKDDDDAQLPTDAFLDDILLDSPLQEEKSGEVVDCSDSAEDQKIEEEKDDDDPLAKKRKRQLRNRDAALRSRERKKMHVKDLELKSRYYEGECKRLGSLLQWYMAENQALRFSLHSSSNASMTKQESAVLLLGMYLFLFLFLFLFQFTLQNMRIMKEFVFGAESLLLGSLLWLTGIMAVLPSLVLLLLVLHHQSQSQRVTVVEEKHLPSLALRKEEGTKTLSVGKRFKASRSRMRRFLWASAKVV
ncbi:putative transcription factor bZIP family [Helianthus annuus]|nr:putative transcription factor bZIP family [Helianthus annuus]